MVHKHLIVSLALGISLAANSALQARGLPVPAAPPLRLAQLAETYDTYIEDSTFSIDYPSGWRIERVGDQYLRLMNYDPIALAAALSDKIKTEVWLIDESPAVVVERELDELQAEEAQVNRYRVVTVDQQSGIRIWLGGLVYDFPNAIKTFVGYGDRQTVMIVSYYVSPDEVDEAAAIEQEAAILRIHDSFKRLAAGGE